MTMKRSGLFLKFVLKKYIYTQLNGFMNNKIDEAGVFRGFKIRILKVVLCSISQITKENEVNIKTISNEDLTNRLTKLVQTERKITHLILECINEIEIRKIHLKSGYASLFDYLTRKTGYTPASAQRRIDGARLLRQIPEMSESIEKGEIHLSQLSLLQKTVREVEKLQNRKVSTLEKREVLSQIISKNSQQTEVILAKQFQVQVPRAATQIINHQDESQSITLHLTKEEVEILEQAKRLLSNKTKTYSLKDALLYLANKEIDKSKNKMIHTKATCNYQDPKTGTKCTANHFLEKDHIQPRWAGGSDDESNRQVLCSSHNKLRYQQQSFLI